MDGGTFFLNWDGLIRILVVGTLAYVALVVVLRTTGKRTLSKMNAFDFVVTVALGSTLATIILSRDVALAEGIVALALLTGLQYVVTWLSVRSDTINRLVKSEPALLFYRGDYMRKQMRESRVVEHEVIAAMRQQGNASMEDVEAVILETDGTMSVVSRTNKEPTVLSTVSGMSKV